MQPYFFPYLGYFQLVHAVDLFVFYDEVAFTKGGWINRNRWLIAGAPTWFTVPLEHASPFVPINATRVDSRQYAHWCQRFLRTIRESYARAPGLGEVLALVEIVLESPPGTIADLASRSVRACCAYLALDTPFRLSSRDFQRSDARGVARVIELCRQAGASCYINPPGGRSLYDPEVFRNAGLRLAFLEPRLDAYPQPASTFVSALSVLDLLLRTDRAAAQAAVRKGMLT